MQRREADAPPHVRLHKAPIKRVDQESGAADALLSGPGDALTPASILKLQTTAGNASVSARMVQRTPVATRAKPGKVKHDEWAEMVAMHVEFVLGSAAYGRADAAGIPEPYVTFLENLSQALYGTRFGQPSESLKDEEREADLSSAETMLAGIGTELVQASGGAALFSRVQGRLAAVSGTVTKHAVLSRAEHEATFAAELHSRPVEEARAGAMAILTKTQDIYSKFSGQVEQIANAGGHFKTGYSLGGVHAGIELGFAVLKATDRETYTKALTEAREWVEEHHAGAVMGMVRATVLVNEMVEVTAGTAGKAVGAMSKIGIAAFIPKGTTLKMLEEMAEAGEAISKSGKIAMKLGKVMEFAEKFDGIISMFNVVGGVAKFITAETKTDRVDSVVKVGTGLASLGAKALGEAAGAAPLAAGAFAVGATWEMTKFFGEMGLDAIEGSLYGGLYQELSEIEPKVDDVARAYLVTDRAMQEHNARFKDANVTDAKAAGAAEAIDDLAYSLQKKLRTAAVRWQNSAIPALYRNFKYGSTSSGEQLQARVANALGFDMSSGGSDSYEATEIADTAKDLVTEFRKEWHNAPFTVLQMAVDQGYMSPDRASEMGAKLAKKAHKE